MGPDQGGGTARRRVGTRAGELPVLDDSLPLVSGTVAVVSPRQQALFLHPPLHTPLRPLPQRLLLRPLPSFRRRRRPTRRPRTRPRLHLLLPLPPQLQGLPGLPGSPPSSPILGFSFFHLTLILQFYCFHFFTTFLKFQF